MSKKGINRREFVDRTLKIIAAAVGLSTTELSRILSADVKELTQTQKLQRLQKYNIYKKSANEVIKGLKVIIENDKRIFENEYGRITPKITLPRDPKGIIPGGAINHCGVYWVEKGMEFFKDMQSCQAVFSAGGDCGELGWCDPNNCDGQSCGTLVWCEPNNCPGNSCPELETCAPNNQILDESFFEQYQADPYIQHLMVKFKVNTSKDLAAQVNNMLKQRARTMLRR